MPLDEDQGPPFVEDFVSQVVDYAVIGLDPRGIIRRWNLGAQRVTGHSAEEAIGTSFELFYTEDDKRSGLPARLLQEASEQGRVEHLGWRIRKDGSQFWGDAVITALHDDSGAVTGYAKVTRDLTEQHVLETALRASEERLRLLVGQVVDYAILALDPEGIILTWNLGAQQVKGYTAEEIIGSSFELFYPEDDRRSGLPGRLLEAAREQGRVEHTGWRIRKDGSRFWGDVVITSLHDETGALTGYAKVTRDRTDAKMLEDAQDAFYATFNHDFRTPITAIKGFVDAIRFADPETREKLIRRTEASADRLLGMVEGLVEFARQRTANATMLLADIDLVQVLRAVVQDLPPALDSTRVVVPDEVLAFARANAVAMHRVMSNLLVNALKYSPGDSPVEVTFARAGPDMVRLSIQDHGRGIDADDLDTIFDEFVRGRLAEADGGTGLGLASVRDLLEQQHGTIEIRSEVGVGTSVTVELPAPGSLPGTVPNQRPARKTPVAVPATHLGLSSSPTGQSEG